MPSIADLRSALGAFAQDKSDEQLLQLAASATGVSPGRIASEYNYSPTSSGTTGLRFGAGIDQYQAGLYGLGEAVTGSDWMRKQRQSNEFSANVANERAQAQGAVSSWEDVNNLSDFGSYAAGLGLQSLPYAGEALLGGWAARGLMGGTKAALTAAREAGNVEAATAAARRLNAGSQVGGVAASYPSAVGDILGSQRDQSGETDLLSAFGYGIPYAAANALGVSGALARNQGIRAGVQALDDMSGLRGGLARMGVAGTKTGLTEAAGETFQESMNQAGRIAVDPNETMFSDAAMARYKESAIGGGILGGMMGGTLGGWRRSEQYQPPQQELNLLAPDQQQVGLETQKPLQLGFSPLAGTPIIFPDGSIALNGEQEMLARTGIKLPVNQEADLTAPAGTAVDTTVAGTPAPATTPAPSKIFNDDERKLLSFGIQPSGRTLAILPQILEANLTEEQLDSVRTTLAQNKFKQAEKIIKQAAAQNIINAMSASAQGVTDGSTGISTVQQPAGGVGVGGAIVPGTLGTAGSDASIAGAVGGGATTTGAPLQQVSLLPNAAGQPSTAVDQGPTTRGAPGTTALVDTSDDALEIARATGNAAEIEAMREDQEGGRADQLNFGDSEMEAVIQQSLAKSKNKERDRKVLQAYLFARKSVPDNYKGDIAQEVADTFNIGKSRVRQLGNPEKLAAIAESMGFDRNQVFTHLGIESATKAVATKLSRMEGILNRLESKQNPTASDISRMAALSAQINKAKDSMESGDLTSALKEMGVEGEAGEMFASMDDSRFWQEESTAGSQMAVKLVGIADKIADLKAAAAELKNLGLPDAEAAVVEKVNELTENYKVLTESITAASEQPKKTKAQKKTEAAQKAAEENDAAKEAAREAEAAKFRAERAAKLAADRKGLEVGDTVMNPKLGTGVVRGFSGDGDATIVTVDFQSGQTKELSVKMAKLEKTNAVQVQSTAVVPVQSEAQTGQGVGGQVRGAEKPAGQGQVTVVKTQGKKQVANKGQALWESLVAKTPGLVPYDQLTKLEQEYLTDLAVRTNGKPSVAKEMGLQQLLAKEPVTIDVEARVIDETVAPKVAALPAPQVDRLEKHYGLKRDSAEFLAKVKEDIVLYATKGAEAVAGAIRDIIKTLHSGVLAAAMIFNPTAVSQIESFIVIPQETQVTTQQVLAEVPAEAAMMSDAGKQAYATLIPALKGKLGNKFITIADKPSGRIFVFKADGSLVLQKKSLFGLAQGDLYKGNNDLPQNRVTPAGLFGIHIVDAAKGGAAATTAGDYDFGKVFALDDPDATVTFMHSVWLKEKDAAQRAAALKNESAADSRYSFGCINVDKETYRDLITKYGDNMDGSKLFVVPDVQSTVNDFITGNVANDRLVREGVQPVTKTVSTPVKSATQTAKVTRDMVGKEEDVPAPKKPILFSKAAKAPAGKNSVGDIQDTFKRLFGILPRNQAYRDFVRVHQTAEEAFRAANKKAPMVQLQNAQAFVDPTDNRVVHLIADNIAKGSEFSVLLHEVGVHVGLKNKLGANFKILEGQVKSWKNSPAGSIERKVYDAAMARVAAARLDGAITADIAAEELVAYAAEEAALAGVKVTDESKTRLEAWVKKLHDLVTEALKNFLGVDTIPSLTAQDLVNFSFAAAQEHMQNLRAEIGSTIDSTNVQVARYYTGSREAAIGTAINTADYPTGQEAFFWNPADKFGPFTGIGTRAFYEKGNPAYMAMVLTSAESREFGDAQNNKQDKVLMTIQAVHDRKTNTWSLIVAGPEIDGALYQDLYVNGLASITKDNEGTEWTRLEGVSRADNMRVLAEFRRRLTRVKNGEVPNIDFTRVTGSGANLTGGNYKTYSADEIAVRYSKAPGRKIVQQNIDKLPESARQPVRDSVNILSGWYRKGLDRLVFTSDLINSAVAAGIKSAGQFQSLLAKRDTRTRELERQVERVADMYAAVEDKFKGSGPDSVNQFIFQSTRTGKWGYGKYRNDKMGAAFDAFGAGSKAQEFIKAVFEHGNAMLAAKKKAVIDYTTSEYDARIAAETDPAKKAALVKDKADDIKQFARLFQIREGIPYAPIKRFGNHVVIAKSREYIDAVAAKDSKLIKKLEQDPDHYHVSFTETENEARNLAAQLTDQGFFGGGSVDFKERSELDRTLFGSSDSLNAITRLRSMAEAKAVGGDKNAAAMSRMVSDLYLQALAETSARKSEMRRRGVSGELDMLRSFAAQGRADANFVASVQYNSQIQDAVQGMQRDANNANGNLNRKSEIFNEIVRRYNSSMEPSTSPAIAKVTRLSSVYYLATSPAYYLQNLTQPWMMSVPAMAGRHDYLKASAALTQAYGQLGGVMKSARLFDQQFDFSKVPSDVRDAIQELVNRGAIDIGMETELGEFKIEGDSAFTKGWNKVDKGLRIAVQKVESINRLSTAMAAYRLELAKNGSQEDAINYAERILTETHGDYSAFNAPRVFNTQLGKIALQFRKFQLIQLSFYAKLLKDAGFSTEEKRAATKTLAYALGHTGMLAGVMGLPGYAAISWALGALFGDEDEPLDVTAELRQFIGDEDMANLIMRGAPTLAGMDISGKVGAGNMLSIMPFSQADLTTRAGVIEAAGTLIGGAPVGMAARVADGLGLMLDGNWYRGLEQVLPKGLGDAVKAYRIADQGTTRRNGDVLLPASEVSAVDTAMQAIGIQPVKQSVAMERQQATVEMNQRFQDRSTKIKADYVRAIRAGESTEEARAAWMKLQEARVNNGYTRQPLSDLLRAPQSQTKREKQTIEGVQFNKTNKRFVEEQI